MRCLKYLVIPLLLVLVCVLAGCGGGGASLTPSGVGRVLGRISATSLGAQKATVSIAGKNLSTSVGADGSFVLDNVPPGLYTLVVKADQQAGAMCVSVASGKDTNIGQMTLGGAGQIAGMVTAALSGNPISGALITVTDIVYSTANETPHPVRECQTNSNGSYTMDALPVGGYLVTVGKDGYLPVTLDMTVTAGSTTTGDVSLTAVDPSTGSLQGLVSGVSSGGTASPLGGVFVVLSPNSAGVVPPTVPIPPIVLNTSKHTVNLNAVNPTWQEYYAFTADDGSYHIDGIPAGAYTATAMRPGFEIASQVVTIVAKQTATLNLKLSLLVIPTGTVIGTVTDSSTKKPIAGATVTASIYGPVMGGGSGGSAGKGTPIAIPYPGFGFSVTATTGADGTYTLQVPTCTWAIDCYASGYDFKEQQVNISQDQTVTLDFALSPTLINPGGNVTLKGTVSQPAGGMALIPSVGATVNLVSIPPPGSMQPSRMYSATTDQNGAYSISVLSDQYSVSAQKDTMTSASVTLKLYQDTAQDFTLSSPATGGGGTNPPPPPPL